MNYANPEISSKLLNAAKNSCTQLIESTAEMVGILDFLREVSEDTGMPLDEDVLFECEQMFITINRLLYEQQSRIKHKEMMQTATQKAEALFTKLSRKGSAQTAPQFNHAI